MNTLSPGHASISRMYHPESILDHRGSDFILDLGKSVIGAGHPMYREKTTYCSEQECNVSTKCGNVHFIQVSFDSEIIYHNIFSASPGVESSCISSNHLLASAISV